MYSGLPHQQAAAQVGPAASASRVSDSGRFKGGRATCPTSHSCVGGVFTGIMARIECIVKRHVSLSDILEGRILTLHRSASGPLHIVDKMTRR